MVYRRTSCAGSILIEWLVAMSLILCMIAMGSSMIASSSSRYELNMYTKEIVVAMKKVQLWSMLGHRNERMSQGEFILKKHAYEVKEGFSMEHVEIPFPKYIESNHVMKRVYFSAYGLPYDGTEFELQDIRSGARNRIWISVQTGRIRWEALP